MTTTVPNGCRHCGIAKRSHARQWTEEAGWHAWEQPTQQQIKDRMRARGAAPTKTTPGTPAPEPSFRNHPYRLQPSGLHSSHTIRSHAVVTPPPGRPHDRQARMTQPPYNPNQPQQPQGPYQGPPQWQGQQPGQPYAGHPQQPHMGAPGGYPGGPVPPQPKRSWFARHKVLTGIGGVFAFFVIVGIATSGGDDSTDTKADTVAAAPEKAADAKTDDKPAVPAKEDKPKPAPKKDLSQADEFKAFINKNGTAAEKAAAKHVVKVQGADSDNDILDAAEVYTDYTGGMMGPHSGDGKLLASAFADWRDSKNGLVTIYDADGELLSNGNY